MSSSSWVRKLILIKQSPFGKIIFDLNRTIDRG